MSVDASRQPALYLLVVREKECLQEWGESAPVKLLSILELLSEVVPPIAT